MTSITRVRELLHESGKGIQILSNDIGQPPTTIQNSYSIVGRQTTTSENHPGFFRNRRTIARLNSWPVDQRPTIYKEVSGADEGGPFTTRKHKYWNSHPNVHATGQTGHTFYDYKGPLFAFSQNAHSSLNFPIPPAYDEAFLRTLGATAIAKVSPLSPQTSIAATLGELRNDGLPLIPAHELIKSILRKEKIISTLGGEYLNYVFGWKPTISDLRKLAHVVDKSSRLIAQIERDSGRLIFRHYDFPTVTTETTTVVASGSGTVPLPLSAPGYWSSSSGVLTKTVKVVTRTWFSGCFSYLLYPGDSAVAKARNDALIAQALFGPALSPAVIWELTPYSWFVDWFTNVGDVISNLSTWATSGQVLRWGYIMRETRYENTFTLSGPTLKSGPAGPFIQKFITIDKRRVKASPYGFQLSYDGLNNQQKAILAALGISRSRL